MRVAYADPPYVGCAYLYSDQPDFGTHPFTVRAVDRPSSRHARSAGAGEIDHARLIEYLVDEFTDGWALSLHTPSLRDLLPLCPSDVRVAAWVKPWASKRPSVRISYTWEPIIFRTDSRRNMALPPVMDHLSANTVQGFMGAKPEAFAYWLFQIFGISDGDEFVDLFPGSGAMSRAWERWKHQLWTPIEFAQLEAFA